ncbi:hypothetical protein MBCUT_08460 [Methanobrevibacter cuticularis]|uniref:Uncharacterized protein n=1 Tax=Methanobrevibacter cuticularis TaxID=47311 RepID=A0A166EAW1_9EURY|nr:hypothetical protein [Methanobrevibacter cuticularis]KZX16460.1 hypothetical protein MBCUT_08460 [Methanobrevibacter cuticularis]
MKKSIIFAIIIAVILIFGTYLWVVSEVSLIEPVGRLSVTKLANPDMFPDHPNAEVLAEYAAKKGSRCVLVVHYGGDSNYRQFEQEDFLSQYGDVTVLELAFVDPSTYKTYVDWNEVISTFLFGIPDDRYTYKADGIHFETLDEAMAYIDTEAQKHGQEGPIPMFYHGTVRKGDPYFNPGCGFPLFTQISWKYYGRFGAYYYVAKSLIWPYVSNRYYPYEISHLFDLQKLYNSNELDYTEY